MYYSYQLICRAEPGTSVPCPKDVGHNAWIMHAEHGSGT